MSIPCQEIFIWIVSSFKAMKILLDKWARVSPAQQMEYEAGIKWGGWFVGEVGDPDQGQIAQSDHVIPSCHR